MKGLVILMEFALILEAVALLDPPAPLLVMMGSMPYYAISLIFTDRKEKEGVE